jgi:hypothetical protein
MASERAKTNHWLEVDVAGALALRRWALLTLVAADHEAADPAVDAPPPLPPATWRAFLEAELCALPLARILPASRRAALYPEIEAVLDGCSSAEAKRVLAARGQLRTISDLASNDGLRVVALKGGVAVTSGFDLDLEDLDFLLPPDHARRLEAGLLRAGYWSQRGGSPRHLGMLFVPGGIGVELHTTLSRAGEPLSDDLWSATVPLEGLTGIERLNPAEHLWHLLCHLAVDHPDRRGRIRDLLLTAQALGDCSEADVDAVQAKIAQHVMAVELEQLLSMAIAMRQRRPIDDEFRRNAATVYTLRRMFNRLPIPKTLIFIIWRWTFAFLGRPANRREMWAETIAPSLALSKYRFIAFLEQRAPRLGRAFFLGFRLLRLPVVLLVAAALAGYARLSLRRLERRFKAAGFE